MGIGFDFCSFMANAKVHGASFGNVLTIGHQTQYLSPKEIQRLVESLSQKTDIEKLAKEEFIDELLKVLFEAKRVVSLEYSDYENSTIIHDMSLPLNADHHEQYDIVIDGGTLEHVFNFPVAIANCMNALKVGGRFFMFTPANNHMGHGFYQFSPELFFRIFQPENGFEIEDIVLLEHQFPGVELSPKTRLYSVVDPVKVHGRVGLVNKSPVLMLVHAVRKEIKPIFNSYPIQSDYLTLYEERAGSQPGSEPTPSVIRSVKNRVKKLIGKTMWERGVRVHNKLYHRFFSGRDQLREFSFSNKRFYKRRK